MSYRTVIKGLTYTIINPLINGMVKVGITPNFITTMGLVFNAAAAGLIIYGGMNDPGNLGYLGWGGGVVLFAGLFDVMDGQVARIGNRSSVFGALYDSILDRYSELLTLMSISYWMILSGYVFGSIITMLALIGSIMVSYVRARAEGLGIKCKVGLMQRPERVVLTALGLIFCGVFSGCKWFNSIYILIVIMSSIALLANLTAVKRISHCRRELKDRPLE